MPQMISEKHTEMHDLLEKAASRMDAVSDEAVIAAQEALAWYDRMLWTLHGIIMKDSPQWQLDSLRLRLSYMENRLRKLEARS